eukprot:scaffold52462_cov71-Phaeocystis_antarctica.AAC.4
MPRPPNLGLSTQFLHSPQSSCTQPRHFPHLDHGHGEGHVVRVRVVALAFGRAALIAFILRGALALLFRCLCDTLSIGFRHYCSGSGDGGARGGGGECGGDVSGGSYSACGFSRVVCLRGDGGRGADASANPTLARA